MSVKVEVWGDYACFSRPEMKVERVSYDVMTPSAARGILDAIYFHNGLRWYVDRIRVLSPIRFTNIRRNEVKDIVPRNVKSKAENGEQDIFLDASESQQRASLLLKDVHYIIEAHFEMTAAANPSDNPGKFQDIMRRRLERGQHFHQPYFGTREFPVRFAPCGEIPPCPEELRGERDLGWMLLDLDYSDPKDIRPLFFRAVMRDGVIDVPRPEGKEVVG